MSDAELEDIVEQITQHFLDGQTDEARALMREVVKAQNADILRLKIQMQKLQKRVYGRRTEKLSDEQLRLFEQHAEAQDISENQNENDTALSEDEAVFVKSHRRKKKKQALDVSKLPVDIIPVPAEVTDCACGKPLKQIGVEDTKLIERVPASCTLKIYRRAKMACNHCKDAGVITAPPPAKPMERSMLSFSLLVDILVSKFAQHMPLNRLRRAYSNEGLVLSTQLLSLWVGRGADILKPLAKEIMKRALAANILNTDDTPVTVLDPDMPGGSKKGRFWVYIGERTWVAFDYTPNWEAERPQELLRRRARGPTQSDGYAGYNAIYQDRELDLYEVACWSHARRGFVDALVNDKRAAEPLRLIKQLFKLEELATAKNLNTQQRREMRRKRSKPIHQRLAKVLRKLSKRLAPKDDLMKAIAYATKRWNALSLYLDDGNLELTNNIAERAPSHRPRKGQLALCWLRCRWSMGRNHLYRHCHGTKSWCRP